MAAELPQSDTTSAAQPLLLQQQQQLQLQAQQAAATSANRILFLVVVSGADLDCLEDPKPTGPRYTRDSLRNLLQLLGCKPRLAFKVMLAVFQAVDQAVTTARQQRISRKTFQVHPHRNGRVYVSLTRADFMSLVSTCAAQYSYKISPSSEELKVACSLRERRRCVVVLLCGTSGSGKSTLASILASRLGITTVVSTDSIRHMLRSFISRESSPLLWASTYQAGEHVGNSDKLQESSPESERALYGYKAQCGLLAEHLEQLIAGCEARSQSLICEGVHLNISTVVKLMARHPSVLPFLVYIPSESRHVERMAVRAKYMTLDPNKNRYVRYMGNIRLIQEYLVRKADKYFVPRVDNSNVDRSVGIIHLTVMSCLRRMARGEPVLDPASGKTSMLAAEYAAVLDHLQGETDRLAAATAGAAGAGSSLSTQLRLQQQQQPVLQEAGGSGHFEAGSGSNTRPTGHAQMQAGLQEGLLTGQLWASSDPRSVTAAPGGMQAERPGNSNAAHAADGVNGCLMCKQACSTAAQDSAVSAKSVRGSADGSNTGLEHGSPDGRHALQAQGASHSLASAMQPPSSTVGSAAVAAASKAPASASERSGGAGSRANSSRGSSSSGPSGSCSAEGFSAAAATPRTVAVFLNATNGHTAQTQQQAAPLTSSAEADAALQADIFAGSPQKQRTSNSCQPQVQEQELAVGCVCSSARGSMNLSAAEYSAQAADGNSNSRASMDANDRVSQRSVSVGGASSRGSCEHGKQEQQQDLTSYVQQQQQVHDDQAGGQVVDELDEFVSSGEELDGLGELGSSDNEGERCLQEYGSVYESTTCDEHDDFDEAGGLRAWNAGMATALWPSYSHVYAPNAAAAAEALNGSSSSAGAASNVSRLMMSANGGAARMLRTAQSELAGASGLGSSRGGSGSQQEGASSSSSRGSHAAAAGLLRLSPRSAAAAAAALGTGGRHGLPTVYEQGPQDPQLQHQQQQRLYAQVGTGKPPLPAYHANSGLQSPRSPSGVSSGPSSSHSTASRAAGKAVQGRHIRRSRSSSGIGGGSPYHVGRRRPASAGNVGSTGRACSAGVEAHIGPEAQQQQAQGVLPEDGSTAAVMAAGQHGLEPHFVAVGAPGRQVQQDRLAKSQTN